MGFRSLPSFLEYARKQVRAYRRVGLTAIATSGCVLGIRFLGILQSLELAALDEFSQWQPPVPVDDRITLVTIDDEDINRMGKWPMSDQTLADLLTQIQAQEPRVVGLDLYRELAVGEGQAALQAIFATTPNLIGIEKLADETTLGIPAPDILSDRRQVGFNNVIVDTDNRVRRSVVFWNLDGENRRSLALQLALAYLKPENLDLQAAPRNRPYFQLGQSVFYPLKANSGGYVRVDAGGYQILTQFRRTEAPFRRVSLTQVLAGDINPEDFRDRIVLIGSTAESLKDFFYIGVQRGQQGSALPISGVELQGRFVSQILGAALEGRSLIRTLPEPLECGWVFLWTLAGVGLTWRFQKPRPVLLSILGLMLALGATSYGLLLMAWWLPMVPAGLALSSGAAAIILHKTHLQDELNKSKEFLNSVINSIPDPIFVKDQQHRWIVLNEAFCRFVGRSQQDLLDQNDFAIFPSDQAQLLRSQDEDTFTSGTDQETEARLTTLRGDTYDVATKRSIHRDAAGNFFLVGLIHDITQRKQLEVELRRKTEELSRSNAELRHNEDRLRHLAYHDGLTGLPNRDFFEEQLQYFVDWSQENDQITAVLFLDLDGFKQINDTYGHSMGNLLLKAVAQRLVRSLRNSDIVARFGGDEFVVLLPSIPLEQDVITVAGKLMDALTCPFVLENQTIHVTTSIGIGLCPSDGTTPAELLEKADLAMYQAKQQGKNAYMLASQVLTFDKT